MELDAGQKVRISNGEEATVTGKPARAGEGLVYQVSLNGRDMLLRWFPKPAGDDLYRKIGNIVDGGAPSVLFVWPLYLTEKKEDGSWGYVSDLTPNGFYDLGSVLLGRTKFSSLSAMLSAAMKLCGCFRQLYEKGLCFSDLTDSNVFIAPEIGDVRIGGGANLAENSRPVAAAQGAQDQATVSSGEGTPGITIVKPETGAVHVSGGENPSQQEQPSGDIPNAQGTAPEAAGESVPPSSPAAHEAGYATVSDGESPLQDSSPSAPGAISRCLAPEVICGGAPDACSDSFSLSVILFILFFGNHPFEGAAAARHPYLTDEIRRKLYGSEAVFIFDPENKNNRPVRGIHQSVLRSWPSFPKVLKDAFVQEFCQMGVRNPKSRLPVWLWEGKIREVRDMLISCPNCGKEMFIGSKCPFCAKSAAISVLVINGGRTVPLVLGKIIWLEGDIAAEVIKDQEGTLLIKNNSLESWSVVTPSGKNKTVPPHGIMPVRDGIRISFRPIVSPHLTAVISNQ